jgi:hypothetical protein
MVNTQCIPLRKIESGWTKHVWWENKDKFIQFPLYLQEELKNARWLNYTIQISEEFFIRYISFLFTSYSLPTPGRLSQCTDHDTFPHKDNHSCTASLNYLSFNWSDLYRVSRSSFSRPVKRRVSWDTLSWSGT